MYALASEKPMNGSKGWGNLRMKTTVGHMARSAIADGGQKGNRQCRERVNCNIQGGGYKEISKKMSQLLKLRQFMI